MKKTTIAIFVLFALLSGLESRAPLAAGSSDARAAGSRRSIGGWVSCTGTSDDTAGVTKALAAAGHGAFTLIVDCPVNIKVGMDIARSIFIDDGTKVEFTGSGKFTVDNVFIPAFVIADSSNITLANWNVEYDASLPVNAQIGGYMNNGEFVHGPKPANAFNDLRLSRWLAANRAIVFDNRQGSVNPPWAGPTNVCAVFFITGDSSNINVTGMHLYAPEKAGGDRFIPAAFSLDVNFKPNQTVTAKTPITGQYAAVPHDLTFSNIGLDGTYMGWVGGTRSAVFENIRSLRYGDLQDANGNNVGGMGKWFAPPHLFYFSYAAGGDPALFNKNITIKNVVDDGPRIGTARDKGGNDTLSGYALSLKLGCVDCSVDNYKTTRPDGFMDVLPSDGLTVSNVDATYDSSFLNNLFPGWRFPASSYERITFKNITLMDTAASSATAPIGDATQPSNEGIVFQDVHVTLNRWTGKGLPVPNITGPGNSIALDYTFRADSSRLASMQRGNDVLTLLAVPATAVSGDATRLTWASKGSTACTAADDWQGVLSPNGTAIKTPVRTGEGSFTLDCRTAADTLTVRVPVTTRQ